MSDLLVLSAGSFGDAVAKRVLAKLPGTAAPLPRDPAAIAELVAGAAFVAVAAWRPYNDLFAAIDELAFANGFGWSLAELHGQRLTLGPIVIPGAGACFQCYRKRWNAHHPSPERELVLEDAYRRDPELGPPGYIAPLVAIAAAALIQDAGAPREQAGQLRLVDVLTGSVLQTSVLGVHACPRCRPAPPGPVGQRFVKHLVPAIERALA